MAQPKVCIRVSEHTQERLENLFPWGTKNRIMSTLEENRVKIVRTQRRRVEVTPDAT
jgi:hypothetical protein